MDSPFTLESNGVAVRRAWHIYQRFPALQLAFHRWDRTKAHQDYHNRESMYLRGISPCPSTNVFTPRRIATYIQTNYLERKLFTTVLDCGMMKCVPHEYGVYGIPRAPSILPCTGSCSCMLLATSFMTPLAHDPLLHLQCGRLIHT